MNIDINRYSFGPPGRTRVAYKQFYPKVRNALFSGEEVFVSIDEYKP